MRIIDLTMTVENGMPTCNTPWHETVRIEQLGFMEEVGRNTHRIVLGSHTGTHMDAPLHFIQGGRTIESTDVNLLYGDITVVDMTDKAQGEIVTRKDLEGLRISERMLFKFGWFKRWKTGTYYENFPYFSEEAVEYLLENGMRLMAMDTPSPDDGSNINSKEDSPNHKRLLQNDIVIVEYLNHTDQLDCEKKYRIAALPLKIAGSDGAPCRVIAIEEDER